MWHLMGVSGWICAQSTLFLEKQPLASLGQIGPRDILDVYRIINNYTGL